MGGRYTTETFNAASTIGLDTIDMSRCASFAIQMDTVGTTVNAGSVDIEQSFNGTDWATLYSALGVTTDGTILAFDATDGPFGLLRVNATAITAGSGCLFTFVGYPYSNRW
jgi:hypothetical protein